MSDLPAYDWDLNRLGEFARREHQAILTGEKTLAPAYWRLGSALTMARRQLGRGRWLPFLETLGIEKTRSSKACAIFRTFESIERLTGFTVAEAYAARPRSSIEQVSRVENQAGSDTPVGDALATFQEQADRLTAIACAATHGELQSLLGTVRRTIDRLQHLERELTDTLNTLEDI
jgi:hypothetical protein